MNADLIAVTVLFGPAAVAGAAVGVAALRQRPHHHAIRAVLTESAGARTQITVPQDSRPPDGGQPAPAPEARPDGLAQVIAFPHRRVA